MIDDIIPLSNNKSKEKVVVKNSNKQAVVKSSSKQAVVKNDSRKTVVKNSSKQAKVKNDSKQAVVNNDSADDIDSYDNRKTIAAGTTSIPYDDSPVDRVKLRKNKKRRVRSGATEFHSKLNKQQGIPQLLYEEFDESPDEEIIIEKVPEVKSYKWIIVIVVATVFAVGTAGYFIYKYFKNKPKANVYNDDIFD